MNELKSKIAHVKRRRVLITELDKCLANKDKAVFSLLSPIGEVNVYYITFEQALDMVDPAIDEDGHLGSELEIRITRYKGL